MTAFGRKRSFTDGYLQPLNERLTLRLAPSLDYHRLGMAEVRICPSGLRQRRGVFLYHLLERHAAFFEEE